jgi:hypothetical protein
MDIYLAIILIVASIQYENGQMGVYIDVARLENEQYAYSNCYFLVFYNLFLIVFIIRYKRIPYTEEVPFMHKSRQLYIHVRRNALRRRAKYLHCGGQRHVAFGAQRTAMAAAHHQDALSHLLSCRLH